MPRWSRWRQERKTAENKNEGVIHTDITENEKETNWDTLKKVIEKWAYDTSPVVMEEFVNDEVDYDNKHILIEENETKLNYED